MEKGNHFARVFDPMKFYYSSKYILCMNINDCEVSVSSCGCDIFSLDHSTFFAHTSMPLLRDNAAARYKVLVATCLLTFGSYYCFDMPSMLEKPLTDSVIAHASFAKKNPSFFYQLFYTVYAWTNMAMSLVAGLMVDRVGLKTSVFLFLSFCLIGSALFGLAFTLTSLTPDHRYILMFVGRFIFGLGGGSITIAQNTITAYWFKNKELAMAFGCTLTISRIGSVINFNLTNR
jgi:MFS family permease